MILLSIGIFALVGVAVWRVRADPRLTRAFWIDAAFATLNYGLYAFLGALLMVLLSQPDVPAWHGLLLLGFVSCWLSYGFVWLTRAGPHLGAPPEWLARRDTRLDTLLVGLTCTFGFGALVL